MNSMKEFILGAMVTPVKTRFDNKGNNIYLSQYPLSINKEYKIIKIDPCIPNCHVKECKGRPSILDDNGKQISICGYGAPNTSFAVSQPDWEC